MHSLDRPRSNSAISLHELDAQSRFRVNHRSISYSSGSHGPPSQDQGSGQGNDQDQDRDRDHDDGRGHHHNSSEPRGAGTAGTAGSEPGDASETPPPWQERPVSRLATFWGSHVSCEVDFDACRDHLAIERTFLGYLRTSMMLSMLGTAVAQLFKITTDDSGFGYTQVGKPMATACFGFSVGTILLGAIRSWRHQDTLIRGKALTGGFEIHILGIGTCLLLAVFFGFMIAIDAVQATSPDASVT